MLTKPTNDLLFPKEKLKKLVNGIVESISEEIFERTLTGKPEETPENLLRNSHFSFIPPSFSFFFNFSSRFFSEISLGVTPVFSTCFWDYYSNFIEKSFSY